MSMLSRFVAWLRRLDQPPVPAPRCRPRRLRATCAACGKDIAVIASTGKLWDHLCAPTPATSTTGATDDGGGA